MKHTIIVALSLLLIASCSKSSSSSSSSATLNSTESQLAGTWYESKEADTSIAADTSYNSTNANYLQLNTAAYGSGTPSNYKNLELALTIDGISAGVAAPGYWYYDPSVSFLVVGNKQFSIISMSSSSLVIRGTNITIGAKTYYLHK